MNGKSQSSKSFVREPMPYGGLFALDAAASETLTEQLTENLRRAIANGVCKPGDKLPGVRRMAALCGTSVQVPIDAVKALAEEGLVRPRPRVGCVVLGRSRKLWHGRLLMVHVGAHSNYGQNVFCSELASRLNAANWRVSHFHVPRRMDGYGNLAAFAKMTAEKFDLVLLPAYDPPVAEIVGRSGHPYMLLAERPGERRGPGCVGSTAWTDSQAVADFAAHCRASGVRRVLVVRSDISKTPDFNALCAAGVEVEEMRLETEMSDLQAESLSRLAYDALRARLSNQRHPRPDLVCFADDYIARGGLWALERLGMRAPEDVKVVSLCNYGNAPFYPRLLTRFEHNHFDYAAKTARAILRYLRTGKPIGTIFCDIRYVRGETF